MKTTLRTDTGLVRAANEDCAHAGENLLVLCDGMGGHRAGDVASKLAVETVVSALSGKTPSVKAFLAAVAKANEQVYRKAAVDKTMRGMGTTLTALWLDVDAAMLAHVGDSRAYLFRAERLRQCTRDHSMVADLVRSGAITKEEARVHPYRNLVTRSVGTEIKVDADIFELGRRPGDKWLLCSDGLTGHVLDDEIEQILRSTRQLDEAAEKLVQLAISRGGTDNITVVLAEDEGGDCA